MNYAIKFPSRTSGMAVTTADAFLQSGACIYGARAETNCYQYSFNYQRNDSYAGAVVIKMVAVGY